MEARVITDKDLCKLGQILGNGYGLGLFIGHIETCEECKSLIKKNDDDAGSTSNASRENSGRPS